MKRILPVDGLRGLAVILILIFHLLNNSYIATEKSDLNVVEILIISMTNFGWVGVNLFFVISGYLIGTTLLLNKNSKNFFKVFYIRRFFRILPIYIVFLLCYLFCRHLFYRNELAMFNHPIPIFYYFFFLQNFIMSEFGHFGPNALTPTWSLAVEEQFYLLIPVVVYFFNRTRLLFISLIFIFISFFYRFYSDNWYEEYTHFLSRADAMFCGVLLALWRITLTCDPSLLKNLFFRISLVSVLLSLYFVNKCMNHLVISVIFVIILDAVIDLKIGNVWSRLLTNKFFLVCGKYSFFIYLFHQLINGLFFILFSNYSNPNLSTAHSYLIELGGVCFTFLLARLSFKYIETPLIRFSHNFKFE